MSIVEFLWYDRRVAARAARAGLWPVSRLFEAATYARRALYDRGVLRVDAPELPTISVGNLTVGGTGKTPFAAWLASRLSEHSAPAIALSGYGADEIEVHRRLNPNVPVVVNADRASAVREAKAMGCDIVILDDAYQHLRLARAADILLLSAEQMLRSRRRHLLPAGPWREPLTAARRASLVVMTHKSLTDAAARMALHEVATLGGGIPTAMVHLTPQALVRVPDGVTRPIASIRGVSLLAIVAIGEPSVFVTQLEECGARVTLAAFRDHHLFSDDEIQAVAARVPLDGFAVCTLKDAVKLAGRWPGPSRLWYVSQQLVVEQGAAEIDRLLQRVLAQRATTTITAG